jgi:hypothetical protein
MPKKKKADEGDALEIEQDGTVKKKQRFDQRDWDYIAESIIADHNRRKRKRADREKQWDDIDRQVAMQPNIEFKKLPNGQLDLRRVWMSEMELPLQAQALEVLTADARRMLFPDSGPWFRAHGEMTDKYLKGIDFQSLILGDETEVPSKINQDNTDKLVEGYLLDMFDQYDFFGRFDRINAEAFKYGMGVGRARMESKNIYIHEARGVMKEKKKIPVIIPVSVRNLYLDDPLPSMHSAQVLGPAHIAEDWIKFENIKLAANNGSQDPDDDDGGWMPDNVKKIEPDKDGYVQILEMEGDIIVPRKTTRNIVIPGAIATVVIGDGTRAVIRFRFRKYPFSSYLLFPYHYEGASDHYPSGPLMKGRPVQIMATDALNRLMDSAALKNGPPVSYDRSDHTLAATGGPEIFPQALWPTTDPQGIKAHTEIGGDPSTLVSVFSKALEFYAELTGILPGRLGAQTVSHTTAFAKDAELQRGAVRTVDYVNQAGNGPVTSWLNMAYQMGRDSLKANETLSFFIDAYGGYVEITKAHLPERASFEWFGSGGPAEEQQKQQAKLGSLNLALKMDQLGMQMGQPSSVNIQDAVREVLRECGWLDLDTIIKPRTAAAPSSAPAVPPNPGLATVALQGLPDGGAPVQ